MAGATIDLLDADYRSLIGSEHVSERLRRELRQRAEPDDPDYRPRTMTADQFAALRALVDRVIPQDPASAIDLAGRLDTMMAEVSGNGWRYEALPTDPEAYNLGLDTLNAIAEAAAGAVFAELSGEKQDRILEDIAAKRPFDAAGAKFDARQMALWFEEMRSDTVRIYVAHPATMARIGYSGIANGGEAGAAFAGFDRIGIGEREDFEPDPRGENRR